MWYVPFFMFEKAKGFLLIDISTCQNVPNLLPFPVKANAKATA